MSHLVPRTVTEITAEERRRDGVSLIDLRGYSAYVLLGEPGAGKTTCFEREARECQGIYRSSRDFLTLSIKPDDYGKVLFIDGLDESRAGSTNLQTPLDDIRRKLDEMGRPPFRLSCREADWFGAIDKEALAKVSPDGRMVVVHLDPLTPEQTATLLAEHGVADVPGFLEHARASRLDSLLGNPQTLKMLAKAISNAWPDSLTQVYALACRKLAEETNDTHIHFQHNREVATDEILDAAGQLFAIQLLAGIQGFALGKEPDQGRYVSLKAIGLKSTPATERALASRLFNAHGHEAQREYSHRTIAEFLGARYLARSIDQRGLPFGRVQALMTSGGRIVSDLRGLHAWLSVHSLSVRHAAIDTDPLGVVLYGDVLDFPPQHKQLVLGGLYREAERYPWFRTQDWTAHPFGALVGPDMLEAFVTILKNPARDAAREGLLDCVFEALAHGSPLPELGELLIESIHDSSHWARNRRAAIKAFQGACPAHTESLRNVLLEIHAGKINDSDDELMGTLLQVLYPEYVAPMEIINYLHIPKDQTLYGSYLQFWNQSLCDKTSAGQWTSLLDQLVRERDRIHVESDGYHIKNTLGRILSLGLEAEGDVASPEQLWNWLGIGLDETQYVDLESEYQIKIAQWLGARPEQYQGVLRIAVEGAMQSDRPYMQLLHARHRFYKAALPQECEAWCVQQAGISTQEDIRDFLLRWALDSLQSRLDWSPALLEVLLAIAERYPSLRTNIEQFSLQSKWGEEEQKDAHRRVENAARKAGYFDNLRSQLLGFRASFAAGTARPEVMSWLAAIYLGRVSGIDGDTPIERLDYFFSRDANVVRNVLDGFKGVLRRSDLPPSSQIIRLAAKGEPNNQITEPCLIGAELLANDSPDACNDLSEEVLKRLVAFRLVTDQGAPPAWFRSLASTRPMLVAEVLTTYAKAMLKARRAHVAGIYQLGHDDAYQAIARQVVLPLLTAFPARSSKEQLTALSRLLIAAFKHADRSAFLKLIETKLALTSLSAANRSHWMAAGFVLDPGGYEPRLLAYAQKNESHAFAVASYFEQWSAPYPFLADFSESAIALLIRIMGAHTSPQWHMEVHRVSAADNTADLVRKLIRALAARPTESTTVALDSLLALPSLKAWRDELRHHREAQLRIRNEAGFRRADASAIVAVLANGPPANPRDLRALLVDHLRDLAKEARDGETTGYRQYWNVDSHGRPTAPRPENDCRDRLLDLLRLRLRSVGVDAQPEGEYRENTRADIRASFRSFNVPIEVKPEWAAGLWTSLRGQLMTQYVVAPGTDGNGIYLVFWFGGEYMNSAPSDGRPKPQSASELEDRLRALLSEDERRLIDVIVFDYTKSP